MTLSNQKKNRIAGKSSSRPKTTARKVIGMMPKNAVMAAAMAAIMVGPSMSFNTNSGTGTNYKAQTLSTFSGISFRSQSEGESMNPFSKYVQNIYSRTPQSTALNVAADVDLNSETGTSRVTSMDQEDEDIQSGSSLSSSLPSREPMRGLPDHEQNSEFELMLGKAMDTLRSDYPDLLTKNPSFEIYDPNIEVVDPSGVTLHSLKSYKTSFQFLHMLVKLFYCPDLSSLTFRLVYDCARKNIRISWNAILVPRAIYGGIRNKLHVDGISVYELDRKSGLINQHRVEHLLLNDAPVSPPQGIFAAIQEKATQGPEGSTVGIPVFYKHHEDQTQATCPNLNVLEFSSLPTFRSRSTSLFSTDESRDHELFNEEAYNNKNASRKKFGLPPISESEFIQIEAETQKLQATQQQKAAAASAAASAAAAQSRDAKKKSANNPFNKMFGGILQDTCESNFDCERPEVCCDFGFKKMCCRSGQGVFNGAPGSLQKIPVRVVADDDQWARRGGPGGMGMNDY
jgi:hypothetical protein